MIFIGTGLKFLDDFSKTEIEKLKSSKIEYFNFYDLNEESYEFIIKYSKEKSEILGIIKTQKSLFYEPNFPFTGINYISVNSNYMRQGVASELIEQLFQKHQDGHLINTDFNESGKHLQEIFKNMAIKYNVYYIDQDILRSLENWPKSKEALYKLY